eukprot:scaffold3889_cov848-Pavlova_lutheri.AAC.1
MEAWTNILSSKEGREDPLHINIVRMYGSKDVMNCSQGTQQIYRPCSNKVGRGFSLLGRKGIGFQTACADDGCVSGWFCAIKGYVSGAGDCAYLSRSVANGGHAWLSVATPKRPSLTFGGEVHKLTRGLPKKKTGHLVPRTCPLQRGAVVNSSLCIDEQCAAVRICQRAI